MAAGKGTRLKSRRPKVLHEIGGKPLLSHVIAAASQIVAPAISYVVVGHQAERGERRQSPPPASNSSSRPSSAAPATPSSARASHRRLRKHPRSLRRRAAHSAGNDRALWQFHQPSTRR
jgi:CTP:molybdopterin cytidylyltransferase MocA